MLKLLKFSGIHVNANIVSDELEKHPDYPSLLAISDVLSNFNIENNAFNIGIEELSSVPLPFIAHTRSNGGDFVVINKIEVNNIFVSDEKRNKRKIKSEDFKKTFSGIVLTVDQGKSALVEKRPNFLIKIPAIITGIFATLVVALIYYSEYFSALSWHAILLILFKTAGLGVSIILLIQSIDTNNPLVQVLCQNGGKKDCNAILSSQAAKVPFSIGIEDLSWSEVGFFYFMGTWLLLLFVNGSSVIWSALALLNLIGLPYTFYSIYYQALIAKKWCVLCCSIQVILWLEFAIFTLRGSVLSISNLDGWSGKALCILFVCLLCPVVLWAILKPIILKVQQLAPLKEQLRKFKYNTELFNKLLNEQPKYTLPSKDWSVLLGNSEANNIIIMVTNPYCSPCAKTHLLLDELLSQKADLQARIIFTANNNENDRKTPVSRHMMALNNLADKTIIRQALHDWYKQNQKDYKEWAKAYPATINSNEFQKIENQRAWCQMAEVTATPALLINGFRLPSLYQLSDLKYMFE